MMNLKSKSSIELENLRSTSLTVAMVVFALVLLRSILVVTEVMETNMYHNVFLVIAAVIVVSSGEIQYRCNKILRQRNKADLIKRMGFDLWLKGEVLDVNLLTPEERDFYYRKWSKIIQNDNG